MAQALSADLTDRLTRLLPLIGSDQGGEVVAAGAAMTRLLKAAGRDWHDVTAALKATPVNPKQPRRAPPDPDFGGSQAIDADFIHDLIRQIRESGCYLSAKATVFLDQLEGRSILHASVYFTPRQWQWFTGLLDNAAQARESRW